MSNSILATAAVSVAVGITLSSSAIAQQESSADWTSDGRHVVFVRSEISGVERLVTIDTVTGEEVVLTPQTGMWGNDFLIWSAPRWSPDGTHIVFSYGRGPAEDLGIMRSDGSQVRRLTENHVYDGMPSWSPDQTQIVFASARDRPDSQSSPFFNDLYVMTLATGRVERVTETDNNSEDFPTYGRDGTSILYRSMDFGQFGPFQSHIESVELASGEIQRLEQADNWFDIAPRPHTSGEGFYFASNRDGNFEIYSAASIDSPPERLTVTVYNEFDPVPLPGDRFGLIADSSGDTDVVTLHRETGTSEVVTPNSSFDGQADMSPDGRRLVYVSHRSGQRQLHERDLVTGDDRVIFAHAGLEAHPRYSPDGHHVAFSLSGDLDTPESFKPASEIIMLDLDGLAARQLTQDAFENDYPVWSSDGSRLAFHKNSVPQGSGDVFVIDVASGDAVQITHDDRWIGRPAWGRDDQVLYTEVFGELPSSRGRPLWGIFEVDMNSGALTRLTDAINHHDLAPQYNLERDQIVFVSTRDTNREIYLMNPDGSEAVRLTEALGYEHKPRWSGDGSSVLFESDRSGDIAVFLIDLDQNVVTRMIE
jgi:Tol biopolymer transport system component